MAPRRPVPEGGWNDFSGCRSTRTSRTVLQTFTETHLKVQSDGEEDQSCRHSHVSSEQQHLFTSILNYHELQRQNTVSAPRHKAAL